MSQSALKTDNSVYLTDEGLQELKAELAELKDVKQPALLTRVAEARSQGDLSENSDYTAARDELAFVEGRIEELEDILSRVKVIKANSKAHKEVQMGSKITVKVNNKEHMFTIVGEWEADPMEKKISNDSPLGKALMGKKEGEQVEIEAPAGRLLYKVIKIH